MMFVAAGAPFPARLFFHTPNRAGDGAPVLEYTDANVLLDYDYE
jgi:hypothetical protein